MRQRQGFTLVEIMVSLVVFSLIMSVMGSAFYKVYQDWVRQRDYLAGLEQARWAMEFLSNQIREANATSMTDAADSPAVDHEILEFTSLQDKSTGGNPDRNYWIWRGRPTAGQNFTLYYSNQTTARNFAWVRGSTNRYQKLCEGIVNGTDIFNVTDAGTGNATVTITLTFRPRPDKPVGSGNRNYVFKTSIRPRN